MWPTNSPDLNPVDYRIWSVMQERAQKATICRMWSNCVSGLWIHRLNNSTAWLTGAKNYTKKPGMYISEHQNATVYYFLNYSVKNEPIWTIFGTQNHENTWKVSYFAFVYLIRYDTIRHAILTWARKPTWVSLIYRTEPTTKMCKTEKLKTKKRICSEVTVNSLGNSCSQSWRRKGRLRWEGFAKRKV